MFPEANHLKPDLRPGSMSPKFPTWWVMSIHKRIHTSIVVPAFQQNDENGSTEN